ncbi:MAG TPA: hypothetical protein VE505_13160, partial [Vicinamibacterales bacterium]|nr:hypothetical protein [Vicinamibacterales bacterium]
ARVCIRRGFSLHACARIQIAPNYASDRHAPARDKAMAVFRGQRCTGIEAEPDHDHANRISGTHTHGLFAE